MRGEINQKFIDERVFMLQGVSGGGAVYQILQFKFCSLWS